MHPALVPLRAVFAIILCSISLSSSQGVPLQGTIIRALTWNTYESGYNRQMAFYHAFDIATGKVVGTAQWKYPTMAAQPLPILFLPEHKLITFGASNGREEPYMWYGIDPRTGNVTATFPADSFPNTQFLYGGTDSVVRNGQLSDVAPYQIGDGVGEKRGIFFSSIQIGKDKFIVRRLQDRHPASVNYNWWSMINPVANVLVWCASFTGTVIDLTTGQTLLNISIPFPQPLGVSNEPGQTAATVKFATSWYLKDSSETCYGFFSLANVSDVQTSWCTGSMKGYFSMITYSEDHNGLFFGYKPNFQDTDSKLYFLPMQWGVRTEPALVPGNITIPAIPWWSNPSRSLTVATSVKFM